MLTSLISPSAFWDFRPALLGENPKVHCKPCDRSLLVVCAKTETAYLIMTSPPERAVSITTKVMTAGSEARVRGKRSLEAPLSSPWAVIYFSVVVKKDCFFPWLAIQRHPRREIVQRLFRNYRGIHLWVQIPYFVKPRLNDQFTNICPTSCLMNMFYCLAASLKFAFKCLER